MDNFPTRPLQFRLNDPTATSNLVQTLSTLSAGAVGTSKARSTSTIAHNAGTGLVAATASTTSTSVGVAPLSLLTVGASQSSEVLQGYTYSEVSVSFTRSGGDPNFGWVNVWVSGYLGDSSLQLVATGAASPISFLCAATGDVLTIYAQTVSPLGVPQTLTSSRQTSVTLGGPYASLAPLASPEFTGIPLAPTAPVLTNNTQIATTGYTDTAVAVETTRATTAEATLTTNETANATAITTETSRAEAAEILLAPLASPTFSGAVVMPTLSPTSALTAGVTGQICWSSSPPQFYVCTAGGIAGSATWTAATLTVV
jgi:hypothetical protein